MDETVVVPSPNWFQVSVLKVSNDDWIVYGGPVRSLCVLKPLDKTIGGVIHGNQGYQAYYVKKTHNEKIVSIDLSRDWPVKKSVITGSTDGIVKHWIIEEIDNNVKIKSTHSLDIHRMEKEEVIGVGFSSEPFAITVGSFGSVVKWDLKSNVARNYNNFLKSFKPSCVACSQHIPLHVAIGTKQGVVVVLDLNNNGKVVYKIRSQDDDIVNLSWCPQYKVVVRKSLQEKQKKAVAGDRLGKLKSVIDDQTNPNNSGIAKNLPEDSFDETLVEEDDMFDIYKDHEPDEFGHKKFEPENIRVEVKDEKPKDDFLAECLKLKEDILKKKNEPEPSIANLVAALDKTHVDSENSETEDAACDKLQPKVFGDSTIHTHKHLLATLGKYGGIKIWSKTGKLVGNCIVANTLINKNQKNKKAISNSSTLLWYKPDVLLIGDGKHQLVECNPLKIDCKNKIVWNVLHTLHKRSLYCIASNAPHIQLSVESGDESSDQLADTSKDESHNWKIWTISQDRSLICYSPEKKEVITMHNTCGGFVYYLQPCPYDAKRTAISAGDGAVRVWVSELIDDDKPKLSVGNVTTFWQNVQGKVLTVAWHPTQENLLAFSTGESRIGLLDASKPDRTAKTLVPSLGGGIYSLCWGEEFQLYACGGGELVVYRSDVPEQVPESIKVNFENKKWDISSAVWNPSGLLVGSCNGAVAVLNPTTYEFVCMTYVFNKMIHNMDWHPQQTSSSSEESPFKDLIAISSNDKISTISILEYADKGDGPKLHPWKTLTGHEGVVFMVIWNPHKDGLLLSTSQDGTVRVWDVADGKCLAIYGGHIIAALSASWSLFPQLPTTIMSGGADCCMRVWNYEDYPTENYSEIKHETVSKKKKKRAKKDENKTEEKKEQEVEVSSTDGQVAASVDIYAKIKVPKRFLLPTIQRQMIPCTIVSVKKMASKYLTETENDRLESVKEFKMSDLEDEDSEKSDSDYAEVEANFDFIKIFGSTNDLNEVLDMEMQNHKHNNRFEATIMLSIFRGHIDAMIQSACEAESLCPFLVSLSPCVSFKYWKNVTQLYLAQIDRLVAKKRPNKLFESRHYGGFIYRKVALLLSQHDVKGAVAVLNEAKLHKEAYVLSRSRHMDSIAEETLKLWALKCEASGYKNLSAICYLALGEIYMAAVTLAKSKDQETLSLAANLAKVAGHPTYANHIEDKRSQIRNKVVEMEDLKPLPLKVDVVTENITKCDSEAYE